MHITEFSELIWTLDPNTPQHRNLEEILQIGAGFGNPWYRSQKEHWLGWLGDYSNPGAYKRARPGPTDAKTIYGRINCAPMLFWLCESARSDPALLNDAFEAVVARKTERVATQCGALRRIIPWADVETRLRSLPKLTEQQQEEAQEAVRCAQARLRKKLNLDK